MILKVWVEESEEYLRSLMRNETNAVRKDKLNSLLLVKTNKVNEIVEISDLLNRHRNTVGRWLENYKKGGLESVLQTKQREKYKDTVINGDNLNKLIERLKNPEGFNSYYEVQEWLKQECDLDVKYATIHRTVRYRLKSKLKVARPTNINKNKENELSFKKTLKIN